MFLVSEIYEANAKNWQSENPFLYRLQPLLRAVVAAASIQCLCAYLLFHFYMVDITLVVVVLVVWPTISAAAATFCVFCVWRFGASFLWQFDAILLSHRSVGHFRVVSGSHKFRHVGHFVAC